MRPRRHLLASALALTLFLPGCDKLDGLLPGATSKADAEAEGKAIGSACRHAGRAIEDCFTLNAKANKAAIFDGWRDMNDYMTKNKIEVVAPVVPREPPKPATPPQPATAAAPEPAPEPAPAEDERKPRSKRPRSGQAADLARDDASMKLATRDVEREPRSEMRGRGNNAPANSAGYSGAAAHGPEHAGAGTHERRAGDTPVAVPAPAAERPPARVSAVGSSEIERAKAFANTP
ncbi:hypothetical protein [Derxia lacustris]|uniref:hypothetical protein n=1 Tax=Derxia lacustris TaxID=764842 RepID=UPI001F1E308A|nr:hypothetical protein [Derxia lacustris]